MVGCRSYGGKFLAEERREGDAGRRQCLNASVRQSEPVLSGPHRNSRSGGHTKPPPALPSHTCQLQPPELVSRLPPAQLCDRPYLSLSPCECGSSPVLSFTSSVECTSPYSPISPSFIGHGCRTSPSAVSTGFLQPHQASVYALCYQMSPCCIM